MTEKNLSVREYQLNDIEKVVNYFVDADDEFVKDMGADKSKFPTKEEWTNKLKSELGKPYSQKTFYYIIWLINDEPIGHSNVNAIDYGKTAVMHLHIWDNKKRKSGFGLEFLKLTIPYYFKHLKLETLICEPSAKNPAPNRTLKKVGFELVKTYDTTPGWINFHQTVNRFELSKAEFENSVL